MKEFDISLILFTVFTSPVPIVKFFFLCRFQVIAFYRLMLVNPAMMDGWTMVHLTVLGSPTILRCRTSCLLCMQLVPGRSPTILVVDIGGWFIYFFYHIFFITFSTSRVLLNINTNNKG